MGKQDKKVEKKSKYWSGNFKVCFFSLLRRKVPRKRQKFSFLFLDKKKSCLGYYNKLKYLSFPHWQQKLRHLQQWNWPSEVKRKITFADDSDSHVFVFVTKMVSGSQQQKGLLSPSYTFHKSFSQAFWLKSLFFVSVAFHLFFLLFCFAPNKSVFFFFSLSCFQHKFVLDFPWLFFSVWRLFLP